MKRVLLAALVLTYGAPAAAQGRGGSGAASLRSPGGRLEVTFSLDDAGRPTYSVAFDGKVLIKPSPLGLDIRQGGTLSAGVELTGTERREHDGFYELVAGKTKRARDRYRELAVSLAERAGARRKLQIVFRAYDDGVAFRYRVPRQPSLGRFDIVDEKSEFRFPADDECWALRLRTFHSNYEEEFDHITVGQIAPDAKVGLPLTVQDSRGVTLAISEADLKDYAGMYLRGVEGQPNSLVSRLSPHPDDESTSVSASAPLETPWRVLLIGDEPGRLVESTIIQSLNPPPAFKDTSWIKPGKSAWDWWSGQLAEGVPFKPGMNDATMKHYIDFAAEFGLEYMLVDAGWYTARAYGDDADTKADITKSIPEVDLPGLVAYGRQRGVGIVVWLHWITARDQMDRAFPYYEKIGVRGVKVDFMDRDDQEMVAFYHRVLKTAAEHHLVVDLHGAYKPTGLTRTYPNYLTQEGVLGAEYNKWSGRATATHNVTLPFTRMLAGPMDYTPGGFRNVTPAEFKPRDKAPLVMTTRAQQLAMYVVYESPLQMVADYPGAYRGQPGAEFLKEVPASWDETRVPAGEIGRYIVVARRHGGDWFIGAMTNEEPRTLRVRLDFLGRGLYSLRAFADANDPRADPKLIARPWGEVNAGRVLNIEMAPGGGYAAYLKLVR